MARTGADAKKYADEDAALAKAREAARVAAAARLNQTTNGNHQTPEKPKLLPRVTCAPTLPESAVVTPSARGPRLEGQRNLQDSTFSISGKHFKYFHTQFFQVNAPVGDKRLRNFCF